MVLGGSLGARRVNQLIERIEETFKAKCSNYMAMRKLYFEKYKSTTLPTVQVVCFYERMDFVYASADIIIQSGHQLVD
jgi:UDP-N-acetylglucosamine--N-acetylmuramyl-(pentapeptide) pyrophosphoryl-undecaprenol N-acetylglucosamine transferase